MSEAEIYMLYKGVYLPSRVHTPHSLQCYEDFVFCHDDIIVVTYPKSGTTWSQEIVPLIMNGGDPASVESVVNWERVPWLETSGTPKLNLEKRQSPRMFVTRFHYNMMPPGFFEVKPKVHLSTRTPVCHGSWFDHVKGWLNAEDKDRIMYICYEEMIMDLKDVVARAAQYLEKPLDTEVIAAIAERCLFKNMRQNNMSNYSAVPHGVIDNTKSTFLRKGIAGDWKNQLTPAEAEYFDAVYKDKMKDVKFKCVWDQKQIDQHTQ